MYLISNTAMVVLVLNLDLIEGHSDPLPPLQFLKINWIHFYWVNLHLKVLIQIKKTKHFFKWHWTKKALKGVRITPLVTLVRKPLHENQQIEFHFVFRIKEERNRIK